MIGQDENRGSDITPQVLDKDYTKKGVDYKRMLEANAARSEECETKNSSWAPGALTRLTKG